MEWYVWVILAIGAVPAWFIIGALTERACRSIFDPILVVFGKQEGDVGVLLIYLLICIIAVLVVTVKITYRFVQWIRGAKRTR